MHIKYKKKKSSIFSFPPNYQRISNKESLVTAHFRNLPSLEPEVRCLRRQIHLSGSLTFPFILNIGQTELSSTSIASNVDTRYFRQNFPPLPSPRLHTHPHTHDTFVAFLNGARALAAATLLNSPLKRDAGRFMAGPSLRFRHVSSWNLCPPRGLSAFLAGIETLSALRPVEIRSRRVCESNPPVNYEFEEEEYRCALEWIKLKLNLFFAVFRMWRNFKKWWKRVSPLFLLFFFLINCCKN